MWYPSNRATEGNAQPLPSCTCTHAANRETFRRLGSPDRGGKGSGFRIRVGLLGMPEDFVSGFVSCHDLSRGVVSGHDLRGALGHRECFGFSRWCINFLALECPNSQVGAPTMLFLALPHAVRYFQSSPSLVSDGPSLLQVRTA